MAHSFFASFVRYIQAKLISSILKKILLYVITCGVTTSWVKEIKGAGVHAENFNTASLSNGLYLHRQQAGDYTEVRKMILIK